MNKVIRIGGAAGACMDSAMAVSQLLKAAELDYIIFDFLGEGVFPAFAQAKDVGAAQGSAGLGQGFDPSFISVHMKPHLAEILRRGIKVITNAGGLQPRAAAAALRSAAADMGLLPRIASVEGDNLEDRVEALRRAGCREMFSGAEFPEEIGTANAYLGAFPIADALGRGADIVITGRVVDSALVLGPLIHEFGWTPEDYDRLAAGTLAGHLLECGPMVMGGTFTDWRDVPDWANMGFPIGECEADGTVTITKPPRTGGLVSVGTVSEQMLYEVSDPQSYFVPDVTADFSEVTLQSVGPDRVRVSGARGLPPTSTYKVCATYRDGWRCAALQPIVGFEATAKAERQAAAILERMRHILRERNLGDWTRTQVDVIGAEASYGTHGRRDSREVEIRMIVDHREREAVELFAREQLGALLGMSVGSPISVLPPQISAVWGVYSFLLPKEKVTIQVTVDDESRIVSVPVDGGFDPTSIERLPAQPEVDGEAAVPLISLAWARSGDKGNLFNVAVIARRPDYLPFIRAAMTTDAVADAYKHLLDPTKNPAVDRYEAPGISALNFVVHDSLGGGAGNSPRLDVYAKTMGQQLLALPIPVPFELAAELNYKAVSSSYLPYDLTP